jgi:hypothetical protein
MGRAERSLQKNRLKVENNRKDFGETVEHRPQQPRWG